MRNIPNLVLLAALAGGLAGPAPAQERRPLRLPPAYVVDQWTTRDGLPQNSVNAIARAPDGALWIGTFGGLVRFDGATFRLQERIDSAGRHVDRVLALATGHDSALWVGTEQGLLRFKNQRFDSFEEAPLIAGDAVPVLFIDRSGVLWIATQRGGLVRHANGRFEAISEPGGRPLGPVTALAEDAQGVLWATASDRLVSISSGTAGSATAPVRGAIGMALHDRAGTKWFTLPDGVAGVGDRQVRVFRREDGITRPSVMIEDAHGGYWLGTANDGLFQLQPDEPGAVRHYALPDGRQQYRIRSALVDDEGTAWFGTDANGLLRARRNLFTTFTTDHGMSHEVATAVYAAADGEVWIGTNCGGLNALDLGRRTVRILKPRRPGDPLGDPCIFALTESPPGTIWAGTYGGGLTRIRGGAEERLRLAGGLRDSVVLALFTDRQGMVWVGTNSGGLAALRDGRVQQVYTVAEGLAHNSVRTIYQARDGALWIGTLGGLSRLQEGRFTNYTAANGLSAEHVRAIYEDADGNVWVGTYGGGLNRFRDDLFTAITRRDGLGDDVVSSILEDQAGRLWMSGNRGIFRVSRQDLIAFAEGHQSRVHAVLYGESDGLRNAETNGGFQPAAWKDERGRMWFPTVRGAAMVDPSHVQLYGRPPAVSIEEVLVNGEPRQAADRLDVGPGRSNLEFRFAGLSLSAPEHLTFRYRLVNFDEEWVEAGTRRAAYYPRLPPGHYTFQVSSANRDGVWNESGSSIELRVAAPAWSTWWFRLTGASVLLGLIALVAVRRVQAARLQRAAREEFSRQLIDSQEHERKRIAGELHDGLGQELLVVKNRALLALSAAGLPEPARVQLEQISGIISESLEGVRGLARNLTPYQLDHLGLSQALRSMIGAVADGVDVRFETRVENVDGLLPIEMEINLYRIVQEAVNNVVRHSGAPTATIHVRRVADEIAVTVTDAGCGFRVQDDGGRGLTGGFGLSGIAERVRILGGRLDIISAPGEGTRIEVAAPFAGRNGADE